MTATPSASTPAGPAPTHDASARTGARGADDQGRPRDRRHGGAGARAGRRRRPPACTQRSSTGHRARLALHHARHQRHRRGPRLRHRRHPRRLRRRDGRAHRDRTAPSPAPRILRVGGGHDHAGNEAAAARRGRRRGVPARDGGTRWKPTPSASQYSVRNPAHEQRVRELADERDRPADHGLQRPRPCARRAKPRADRRAQCPHHRAHHRAGRGDAAGHGAPWHRRAADDREGRRDAGLRRSRGAAAHRDHSLRARRERHRREVPVRARRLRHLRHRRHHHRYRGCWRRAGHGSTATARGSAAARLWFAPSTCGPSAWAATAK